MDSRPRAILAGLIFPSADDTGRLALMFPHDASTAQDQASKILPVRGIRHDDGKRYDLMLANGDQRT
jgi:hypothetical protein